MRIPRIYEGSSPLKSGSEIRLDEYGAGHVSRVLRLKKGDQILIFDGRGHEFKAELTESGKKTSVLIGEELKRNVESPLTTELLQVISRGDRMDFTVQKATELGISRIVPLFSERCSVSLDKERSLKKIESYRKIAVAACEQCGRNVVPEITAPVDLKSYMEEHKSKTVTGSVFDSEGFVCLTLDPKSQTRLSALERFTSCRLLIGPEGGFSDEEVQMTFDSGFTGVSLGPRILRTETAALTALSVIGSVYGDL